MNHLYIISAVLGFLSIFIMIRILLGPTIFDRLMAFNSLSSKIIMIIVLFALALDQSYLLDIALAYTLFSFISTVLIARFVRKRGEL